MNSQTITDWKTLFEAIHAASVVLVPIIGFLGWLFRDKLKQFMRSEFTDALKEQVKSDVSEIFEDRTPMLKQIAKDANEELLTKINGTYVRSREQKIRDENVEKRLDRIETKVDSLVSRPQMRT